MGTDLTFSIAYHPQTGGQTEQVNQILEDMLRSCAIIYGKNWEECLSFAEFSYNNSYQASIGMSPFEALYGRSCRTPFNWSEPGEQYILAGHCYGGGREGEDHSRTITNSTISLKTLCRSA